MEVFFLFYSIQLLFANPSVFTLDSLVLFAINPVILSLFGMTISGVFTAHYKSHYIVSSYQFLSS